MLKFISVIMMIIGSLGVALDFYAKANDHLCYAMLLFMIVIYFLFY